MIHFMYVKKLKFLVPLSIFVTTIEVTEMIYEGDPRSNANPSVISSTFGISKNGLHVYYDI